MRSYDDVTINLSTLAAGAAIKGNLKIDASREQGIRMQKMKAAMSWNGLTDAEGPLMVGLCNSDLSPTEIAECIAADPQKELDTPATEQVMREVFPIWFIGLFTTTKEPPVHEVDAGMLREIRYPWKEVIEGNGLSWFVMNLGGGALTTGVGVHFFSVTIGEWRDD